ncbi:hypothetical protein QBC36DRAFT_336574 [Triangularia setosa]|uniref:Uncharacterized protein n=1 Tax=Triangularia setosa TaxID=2587417 RepID=A0AAN6W176_9PEZI|nr:hypothetical protein QBC36DRAFT_336574 [Podospora setosa]
MSIFWIYNNTQADHQSPRFPFNAPRHKPPIIHRSSPIISLKRSLALAIVGVMVFLFLAVIGLSAGLGISQRHLTQAKSELQSLQTSLDYLRQSEICPDMRQRLFRGEMKQLI